MKTAFITGGSRGIGAAAVRLFCQSGYHTAFTYHNSSGAAIALADETSAIPIRMDAADPRQAADAVHRALNDLPHIDVLINNAGASGHGPLDAISDGEWRRVIDVNLTGVFYVIKAALPGMISRKSGTIINVSSIWGITGASCEAHYSAAKAGVIGLTKALAKELAPSGITVNCVAPGAIDTDMNASLSAADREDLKGQIPLGRLGSAEEIARTMLFLASSAAAYMTGQVISPNGGMII
jgi:3-oxoacyl-[acyl-carrier protein] reductase